MPKGLLHVGECLAFRPCDEMCGEPGWEHVCVPAYSKCCTPPLILNISFSRIWVFYYTPSNYQMESQEILIRGLPCLVFFICFSFRCICETEMLLRNKPNVLVCGATPGQQMSECKGCWHFKTFPCHLPQNNGCWKYPPMRPYDNRPICDGQGDGN